MKVLRSEEQPKGIMTEGKERGTKGTVQERWERLGSSARKGEGFREAGSLEQELL